MRWTKSAMGTGHYAPHILWKARRDSGPDHRHLERPACAAECAADSFRSPGRSFQARVPVTVSQVERPFIPLQPRPEAIDPANCPTKSWQPISRQLPAALNHGKSLLHVPHILSKAIHLRIERAREIERQAFGFKSQSARVASLGHRQTRAALSAFVAVTGRSDPDCGESVRPCHVYERTPSFR